MREALVAGRTAAWLGDDVWGGSELLRGIWKGAIVIETAPGRNPILRVRNTSSMPMRIAVRRAPEWVSFPGMMRIEAGGETVLRPGFSSATPAGEHVVQLELEVSNLHVGPGRNYCHCAGDGATVGTRIRSIERWWQSRITNPESSNPA